MNKVVRRRTCYQQRAQDYMSALAATASDGNPYADTSMVPSGLLRRKYFWRKADFMSEFVVPVANACVYGVLGGAVGCMAGYCAGWPTVWSGMIGGVGCFGVSFVLIQTQMLRSMEVTDEFGDETIEETPRLPSPQPEAIAKLEIAYQGTQTMEYQRFLVDPSGKYLTETQLEDIARTCLPAGKGGLGKSFSRSELASKRSIIPHDSYPTLVEDMQRKGLLRDKGKGPRAGVELTRRGENILAAYLDREI